MLKLKLSGLISFAMLFSLYGETTFNWNGLPSMPPAQGETVQAGVAGAFSGLLKVKLDDASTYEVAIVAGGANFPNTPLVDGGKKVFQDDIFLLGIDGTNYAWQAAAAKIPSGQPVAYGASLQWSDTELMLIGGQTEDGTPSAAVNILTLNSDKSISIAPATFIADGQTNAIPALPVTAINASALLLGDTIWLIAGQQSALGDEEPMNRVFKLTLVPNEDTGEIEWVEGLPLPGPMRSQHITVVQKGGFSDRAVFYVVSGIAHIDGGLVALSDGYAYLKGKGQEKEEWRPIAPVKPFGEETEISLLGGNGLAVGVHNIIFFGGYNKEVFNGWASKPAEERKILHKEFFGQEASEFNWNRKVLSYNTVTDTWTTLTEMPEGMLPNCGASAFKKGNDYLVTGGEIKPGVRTDTGYTFSIKHNPSFGAVNWVVLVCYLFGMLLLGAFFMRRENGTEDFFKGGGRVPWWAAGVSIFATMLSSISFMAIPGMTYAGTWGIFLLAVTITLSQPVVIKYYLPFFRRLNVTTAYEYLEKRFNVQCRTLASLVFILFMIVRIGIVSYLPAIALQAVTGINIVTCIFGIGIITIIYCTMGGVEAVIWGDFIQGLVLIIGAVIAFLYIASGVDGGVGGIINIGIEHAKFEIIDTALSINKPTIWILLVGGFLSNLFTYTSDQSVIQRYITVKDEKSATKSIWVNAIACIPVSILFYAIGTGLYAYYQGQPELLDVAMNKRDQIFPFFIMQKLPVGLAGLLIAAVFSATMSTLSSNINSAATAVTTDFYQRFKKGVNDHQCMRVARVSTVLIGASGILIAYALYLMKDMPIFDYFNMIVGLLVSGLGVLFVMGIFSKKITGWGAITGFIISSIVLYFVKQASPIHWSGYSIIVLVVCVIIAYITSILFGDKKDIDGLTIYTLRDSMDDETEAVEGDSKDK